MILLLILTIGLTVAAGVYLLLAPDLFRLIVGLTVLGGAGNLILFTSGRPWSLVPPVIESGAAALPGGFANPLPQALVLTAIVIGFGLLCFALVLGARLARTTRVPDRLRATEPEPHDPVKPPIEDS
jgi:multicomponent Na+:H+ antiporter subunit C